MRRITLENFDVGDLRDAEDKILSKLKRISLNELPEEYKKEVIEIDNSIYGYRRKVKELELEIKQAREERRKLESNLTDKITSWSQRFPEYAFALYWAFHEPGIEKKLRGFNLNYTITCKKCGWEDEVTRKINSVNSFPSFSNWNDNICPICREKEAKLRREQYEQTRIKAKEHLERDILALKQMPYQEYLETEHWQHIRRYMLRRAKYKCELCEGKGVLHVHHKTYERRGEEKPEDLIVLCEHCHAKQHNIKIEEESQF